MRIQLQHQEPSLERKLLRKMAEKEQCKKEKSKIINKLCTKPWSVLFRNSYLHTKHCWDPTAAPFSLNSPHQPEDRCSKGTQLSEIPSSLHQPRKTAQETRPQVDTADNHYAISPICGPFHRDYSLFLKI